ncbi:MAG TPA: 30S ribosomal protein S6 [Clostridia bacterium]|nr:30S ribosomal protein S6 [Clostridia bacterium]
MKPYELMFIVKPELGDEAVDAIMQRVQDIVKSEGGNVDEIRKWGKRRLAYEIKGYRDGLYILAKFTADPPVVRELDRQLKITDEVIRFMICRAS